MTVVELSCPEAWREISEMIDGTLPETMRVRLEMHLLHCAHCRAVFDGTRNTVQLLGDDDLIDLPDGFGARLFEKLQGKFCHG